MRRARPALTVTAMDMNAESRPDESARLRQVTASRRTVFRDLRRRNEYSAKVARMLEARRERLIERIIQANRKRRRHQAR